MWLAVLLMGCSSDAQDPAEALRTVEAIADDYLAAMLERYPQLFTYYAIPGGRHDGLFDNSAAAGAAWQAREDAWLAELELSDRPSPVGSRDWITYGILRQELEASVMTRICRSDLWNASVATAWHNDLPPLFDIQPLETSEYRQQALTRLAKVAGFIDTEIENLRRGLELGYSAPRVTVSDVPGNLQALLAEDNPFLAMLSRANDTDFEAQGRAIFDAQIRPAVERFVAFIEDEYLPRAREEIALTAHPDGAACYSALIEAFTTIGPTPEEIHAIGLEQVSRIRGEMKAIIDAHFGRETVSDFLRRVNVDPEFTYRSEAEVLQHSIEVMAAVKSRMPEAFSVLPKADVVIRPYPEYRGGATGEYQSSSEDGTRPGIFYIPVSDPLHRPRAGQQTFLHHETYPGHHLQGAIALELGDRVHAIARYLWNSGYGEGWALYSERLADEMGLYAGDPLGRLGMLSDQGARAARLVIDTGLHTKAWTRQQAVDYMLANTAWSTNDIEYEIDRYISWPGQATAYMLGQLEIQRLRSLAREQLGDSFDLRSFHERVLENGSITLPMLEAAILAWVESGRPEAARTPDLPDVKKYAALVTNSSIVLNDKRKK